MNYSTWKPNWGLPLASKSETGPNWKCENAYWSEDSFSFSGFSRINVGVIWSRKTKKKPIYDHNVKEIFGVAISVEKFFDWSKKLFFHENQSTPHDILQS